MNALFRKMVQTMSLTGDFQWANYDITFPIFYYFLSDLIFWHTKLMWTALAFATSILCCHDIPLWHHMCEVPQNGVPTIVVGCHDIPSWYQTPEGPHNGVSTTILCCYYIPLWHHIPEGYNIIYQPWAPQAYSLLSFLEQPKSHHKSAAFWKTWSEQLWSEGLEEDLWTRSCLF